MANIEQKLVLLSLQLRIRHAVSFLVFIQGKILCILQVVVPTDAAVVEAHEH